MPARTAQRTISESDRAALRDRLRRVVGEIGTQAKAAALAQVSVIQMKRYLAGKALPVSYEVAQRLAVAAGYNPEWLLTGSAPERPPPVGSQFEVYARQPLVKGIDGGGAERHRKHVTLTRSISQQLRTLYVDTLGFVPTEEELDDAAETFASLLLLPEQAQEQGIPLSEAAGSLAFRSHRQAHRILAASRGRTGG